MKQEIKVEAVKLSRNLGIEKTRVEGDLSRKFEETFSGSIELDVPTAKYILNRLFKVNHKGCIVRTLALALSNTRGNKNRSMGPVGRGAIW